MTTRNLMRLSALFMGVLGIGATFLPQEILAATGIASNALLALAVQVGGALYLGFAMLNWMAQASLIGGIYGRPVAVANLTHFAVVALALAKALIAGHAGAVEITAAVIYAVFAILFALVLFTHPKPAKGGTS